MRPAGSPEKPAAHTARLEGETPICTLSPQPREDSSTAGPYPHCVTSVAPSARDGLVRTVVVIEDEQPIAQAVSARLRSEGYAVDIAADGPSGVALCARIRPDLVVLDLMLPGLDGIEVCKRIQSERPVPVGGRTSASRMRPIRSRRGARTGGRVPGVGSAIAEARGAA